MATAKVKQFWTAFISVLFALLASVGLASTATAAQAPAVQQPEEPASSATTSARTTAAVPAQRAAYQWPAARDRALPPTIKQRIHAEAHNASPSVRHLRADAPVEAALADQSELSGLALAATAK
jgi:opacity protein-like surface antigen